jgi:hypothetical protein
MEELKTRLLNTHTVNGIGIAMAATGVMSAEKVDAVNALTTGHPALTILGLALVVLSKIFRKH